MAWHVNTILVGVSLQGTLIYTATANGQSVLIRASAPVLIGDLDDNAIFPVVPGQDVTVLLNTGDTIFARTVARPGTGQPTPVTATVFRLVTDRDATP